MLHPHAAKKDGGAEYAEVEGPAAPRPAPGARSRE
jgi:hypothetical protein